MEGLARQEVSVTCALRPIALTLACAIALAVSPLTEARGQLRATPVASGLDRPLGLIAYPGRTDTFLVFEQAGRVRVLQAGAVTATDFVDLRSDIASGGEQGLLGMVLAPDFTTSGRFFLSFTNRSGDSVIARMRRSASNPLQADPASRVDLRWHDGQRVIRQPFTNHNGGHIAFGPDGYLYVGLGDGGSSNDPMHRAQDPASLLGKMLRLDVSVPDSDANGYVVPNSNPFVGRAGVFGEIWAFGLRNPWRWSFDDPARGGTGAIVIGDVGQNAREEIDYEPRGAGGRNYGWRNREGFLPNVTNQPPFSQPLQEPIWDYPRDMGRSVTGGVVYRGSDLGQTYLGRYFFGDFVTSRVWSLQIIVDPVTREARADNLVDHTAELGAAASSPASFAVDARGEVYVLGYGGTIYRLAGPDVPPTPVPPVTSAPLRPHTDPPIGRARPRP
jgi:glucose/arabinose dehydrogenase